MGKRKHHHQGRGKAQQEKAPAEDLDRFAGSSDEEEEPVNESSKKRKNDESEDDDHEDGGDSRNGDDANISNQQPASPAADGGYRGGGNHDDEGDVNDVDSYDGSENDGFGNMDDDDSEEEEQATGMANAMARILGRATKAKKGRAKKSGPEAAGLGVVLSKTTTPLQRQAEQERLQEKGQKEKRRQSLERKDLEAFHIPLGAAASQGRTSSRSSRGVGATGATDVASEIEQERHHKRIATRGVVALFNAIAQHQKGGGAVSSSSTTAEQPPSRTAATTSVTKMTKHGFLDMIKSKALSSSTSGGGPQKKHGTKNDDGEKKNGWTALRDDFMLDSKKDWEDDADDPEDYAVEEQEA